MSDFDLVLSGIVVLPSRILDTGWVVVRGETIAAVGEGVPPAGRETHALGRALILPGAIDAKTHSLSQKGQEDFVWSTRTAAAGGVTTLVDMPYDEGAVVNNAAQVATKAAHAAARARVDAGVHNEDDESVQAGIARTKAAGITDWGAHGLSRPPLTHVLAGE